MSAAHSSRSACAFDAGVARRTASALPPRRKNSRIFRNSSFAFDARSAQKESPGLADRGFFVVRVVGPNLAPRLRDRFARRGDRLALGSQDGLGLGLDR